MTIGFLLLDFVYKLSFCFESLFLNHCLCKQKKTTNTPNREYFVVASLDEYFVVASLRSRKPFKISKLPHCSNGLVSEKLKTKGCDSL